METINFLAYLAGVALISICLWGAPALLGWLYTRLHIVAWGLVCGCFLAAYIGASIATAVVAIRGTGFQSGFICGVAMTAFVLSCMYAVKIIRWAVRYSKLGHRRASAQTPSKDEQAP